MKIAPLIYSRTGQHEYFGNFAVRPADSGFHENISWAAKKIRTAMNGVAKVNRRVVVISKGATCIAGIACAMDYFVEKGDLTADEKAEATAYALVNNNTRRYEVFLGYVFKKTAGEIPSVTDSDLWQMFKKKLVPIWNDPRAKEVEVDYYFECASKPAPVGKIDSQKYGVTLYDSAKISAEALFEEYLARAQKEDVAFCSNIDTLAPLEDKIFTAVSTSARIIDALKKRHDNKQQPPLQPVQKPQTEKQSTIDASKEIHDNEQQPPLQPVQKPQTEEQSTQPEQIQHISKKKRKIRKKTLKNKTLNIKKIITKPIQWIQKIRKKLSL